MTAPTINIAIAIPATAPLPRLFPDEICLLGAWFDVVAFAAAPVPDIEEVPGGDGEIGVDFDATGGSPTGVLFGVDCPKDDGGVHWLTFVIDGERLDSVVPTDGGDAMGAIVADGIKVGVETGGMLVLPQVGIFGLASKHAIVRVVCGLQQRIT